MSDLTSLFLATAVTSRWPVLHVHTASETDMLAARAQLEAALGPLPQTDEIEPWDDTEPDWELRVALPNATIDTVIQALRSVAPFTADIAAGPRPGLQADIDVGRPVFETVGTGPITARMWFDPEDGGSGLPDVRACPADAAIAALEVEFALALQQGGVTNSFRSDRGPDTVTPVVHRPTGRLGVRLVFPDDAGLDRHALIDALALIIAGRRTHPTLRLATDVLWDLDHGTGVTVWLLAPPTAGLPGDTLTHHHAGDVTGLLEGLDDSTPSAEVHVVAAPGHAHDAAIHAVSSLPLPEGALTGDVPRWIGPTPQFAATWRLDTSAAPARAIDDWVQRLQQHPSIAHIRVVPGPPNGLAERWPSLEPTWRLVGDTAFQRIRDPLTDLDRQPDLTPTETPGWATELSSVPGVESVLGGTTPDGAEVASLYLMPEARSERVLDAVLTGIAARRPANTRSVVWWAYAGDRAIVHVSTKRPREKTPPW